MKHLLTTVMLTLLMISCSSIPVSKNEVVDGPYKGYFSDGSLKQEGLIKRGEMQGNWKFYYPDGNLAVEGFYRNGELDTRDTLVLPEKGRVGKWTFYYDNGTIRKTGSFEGEFMTGLWHFYTKDGVIDGKGKYRNGNGSNPGASGVPRHGREGEWFFYAPSGSLRSAYIFADGELHGKANTYYDSGALRSESWFANGQQDSTAYGLYESGNLQYRVQLKDGIRVGLHEEWYDNGQQMIKVNYAQGKPHGKFEGWYEDGQKKFAREFDMGNELGLSQAWYPNGNQREKRNFKNGVTSGTSTAWHENGQLKYTVDYIDGIIKGNVSFWDESGQRSTEDLVLIETSQGTFVVDVYEDDAPLHAANFKQLAGDSLLNGIYFHRIIPDFVVQGGDPLTRDNDDRSDDGTGGIGDDIKAEIGRLHLRGTLGAARDNNPEKLSSGSQFYVCLKDLPQLDNNYTVFGEVVLGMDVLDKMATFETDDADNPIEPITIIRTQVGNTF